ncbi:46230_t:CDS:2, partial [Gigaspora margarita]
MAESKPFIRFPSRRSVVFGTHAMVASTLVGQLMIRDVFSKIDISGSVIWALHSLSSMCIYSQPLACHAGLEILKKGGNAADAAVAVSAALNVTEPTSTGIGGDCFCLFYDAKTKKVSGLNGSGRSPANLTLEYVLKNVPNLDGKKQIPNLNINAVTVPGAAAGWVDTVDWFGSGKLKLTEILKPAIDLAENGYPVSEICASN